MEEQIITIYCLCDEVVKSLEIKDDLQCRMNTAEIMTFALLSAIHYRGDYRLTCLVAHSCRYFRKLLSHSRIVRRIHSISPTLWQVIFAFLKIILHKSASEIFIVDSFPVKAYENHKSFRARLFRGKLFHGYAASKKQYFFGIKVHMVVDEAGCPIEFCMTPASFSDIHGLQELPLDLPKGSILFGDKAYNSYEIEEVLLERDAISLLPKRKKNQKRQLEPLQEWLLGKKRNRIETSFSSIVSRMPRTIRARSEAGFYLKITLFILASMANTACPIS